MQNKIDSDKLRLWRKERYLSQEQVAEQAGLSVRTVQRLEKGGSASYDSAVSLANVYDVEVSEFMVDERKAGGNSAEVLDASGVDGLKLSFGIHAMGYVLGMVVLLFIDMVATPNQWIMVWPIGWWTIGFLAHGMTVLLIVFIERMKLQTSRLKSAQ